MPRRIDLVTGLLERLGDHAEHHADQHDDLLAETQDATRVLDSMDDQLGSLNDRLGQLGDQLTRHLAGIADLLGVIADRLQRE